MADDLKFWRERGRVCIEVDEAFIPQTLGDWDRLKAFLLFEQDWLCTYCDKLLTWRTATFDHLIPRVQDGTDHRVNLAMACQPCNSRKGGRSPLEWLDPAEYAALMAEDTDA